MNGVEKKLFLKYVYKKQFYVYILKQKDVFIVFMRIYQTLVLN